ncbi:MAG TPA: hypothetical protein VG186_06365 [Solirubrobacteraceae bacterium]|nr:hypothetical protein [Solirubrobacteraceae bacterium]
MPISTLHGARRRCAVALAALAVSLLALGAASALISPAHAATRHGVATGRSHRAKHARRHRHRRAAAKGARKSQPVASARQVTFGIYPGGAAGTVGPSGPVAPEDPAKRLAALKQLKPAGAPFVLHLYASYTGAAGYSAAAQVGADISSYTANGFQVELVLCYRPADLNAAADVPGFAAFVRDTVDELGSNPGLVSLQVTNEANVGGAPNASDGYYPGAKDALIDGVIEASYERTVDHDAQLKVGFNWAYATDAGEKAFWTYLGQHGGAAFLSALDWVGIDAYPGTWGPALASGVPFASAVRQATVQSLSTLRQTYMPLAGIPASVPMHVSENGYPTGPGRTYAMQSSALQAMVHAVVDYSGTFNVSDYSWFDLRDADSSSTSFESQYGLMTDTYAPKPAFAVYQQLVASL